MHIHWFLDLIMNPGIERIYFTYLCKFLKGKDIWKKITRKKPKTQLYVLTWQDIFLPSSDLSGLFSKTSLKFCWIQGVH